MRTQVDYLRIKKSTGYKVQDISYKLQVTSYRGIGHEAKAVFQASMAAGLIPGILNKYTGLKVNLGLWNGLIFIFSYIEMSISHKSPYP